MPLIHSTLRFANPSPNARSIGLLLGTVIKDSSMRSRFQSSSADFSLLVFALTSRVRHRIAALRERRWGVSRRSVQWTNQSPAPTTRLTLADDNPRAMTPSVSRTSSASSAIFPAKKYAILFRMLRCADVEKRHRVTSLPSGSGYRSTEMSLHYYQLTPVSEIEIHIPPYE